jgi:hypothetical protein
LLAVDLISVAAAGGATGNTASPPDGELATPGGSRMSDAGR